MREDANEQYPEIPEEAIAKFEDERPMRMIKRPEEERSEDGDKPDIEDGENSSDFGWRWHSRFGPAIRPGI